MPGRNIQWIKFHVYVKFKYSTAKAKMFSCLIVTTGAKRWCIFTRYRLGLPHVTCLVCKLMTIPLISVEQKQFGCPTKAMVKSDNQAELVPFWFTSITCEYHVLITGINLSACEAGHIWKLMFSFEYCLKHQ